MYTMLTSAQSIELDCDRKRFSRSAFSAACICTVKPRSLVACAAIAGMAVTGGPAWRSTTSLMFCAQIIGKPLMAPDPAAAPAPASKARRETPFGRGPVVPDVMVPDPAARVGSNRSGAIERTAARCTAALPVLDRLCRVLSAYDLKLCCNGDNEVSKGLLVRLGASGRIIVSQSAAPGFGVSQRTKAAIPVAGQRQDRLTAPAQPASDRRAIVASPGAAVPSHCAASIRSTRRCDVP